MKIYTAHLDPDNPPPLGEPVFVKEGFNLWAFFFAEFWLLYHRMWLRAALVIVAKLLITASPGTLGLNEISAAGLQLALQMYIGLSANDWRRDALKKRGYIVADIVAGDSETGVQHRFFERFVARVA